MAGGSFPTLSGLAPTTQTFPAGDTRTWSVSVAKDLTGYTAEWRMGVTANSLLSGRRCAGGVQGVVVLKASGANLAIAAVGDGTSMLTWTTTYADTVGLNPGLYDEQVVVIDPQGNPTTVHEGRVMLTQSLRAMQVGPVSLMPLSPVVTDNFAIWQGDDTPPKVWSFGTPGNLANLTGSTFALTLDLPGGALTIRSDTPGTNLIVDTAAQTATWAYTTTQSAAIPATGVGYQLHRLIAGTTQLWTHGTVVGLAP